MRTYEQITADARPGSPFSNGTSGEIWMDGPYDGDDGDPEPEPGPPPVIDGQIDMFEVFADQVVDALPAPEVAHA